MNRQYGDIGKGSKANLASEILGLEIALWATRLLFTNLWVQIRRHFPRIFFCIPVLPASALDEVPIKYSLRTGTIF